MKMPVGRLTGQNLDEFFNKSIDYHSEIIINALKEFEPNHLYNQWRRLVRCIDEIINIEAELDSEEHKAKFLQLNFDFSKSQNLTHLKEVLKILDEKFGREVANRFKDLAIMSFAINNSYQINGIFNLLGTQLSLSNTANSISFYQSRRIYYVTILALIPQVSCGNRKVPFTDLLNQLQYKIDSCMVGITTAYYNLLLNQCLSGFEMISDGKVAKGNFHFSHLEGFFLEPQRLSLIDQMELRPDRVIQKNMLSKAGNRVFSFNEVINGLSLFEGAFNKYEIVENTQFKEIKNLISDITPFVVDDYDIEIEESIFQKIENSYKTLELTNVTSEYFIALNSHAPFQKSGNTYYSTVPLVNRFVYQTLSSALLKNKTFQIHSGFVFEDKVSQMLEYYGFKLTNITRINHKEFDLITIL